MTLRHALAAAAIALPAAAHADALQDRLVVAARANQADGHGFQRTVTIERTGAARKVVTEQYDPRRASAERWSLLSVDGHTPTPKEQKDWAKADRGPAQSYANLAKWLGTAATRSDLAGGAVLYRYPRLPAGTIKIGSHDASADTQAEVLVNTRSPVPFAERIRLSSTKGFRIMLVASLKTMVVDSRYRQLPGGPVVPAGATSDITGSLMGKSGMLKTVISYSDLRGR